MLHGDFGVRCLFQVANLRLATVASPSARPVGAARDHDAGKCREPQGVARFPAPQATQGGARRSDAWAGFLARIEEAGQGTAMELEVIIASWRLSSRRVSLSTLCVYGDGWVAFNWLELLRPELHFILERG
jgi:hypothetical protein